MRTRKIWIKMVKNSARMKQTITVDKAVRITLMTAPLISNRRSPPMRINRITTTVDNNREMRGASLSNRASYSNGGFIGWFTSDGNHSCAASFMNAAEVFTTALNGEGCSSGGRLSGMILSNLRLDTPHGVEIEFHGRIFANS
jgi:hypothetical protein